MKYDINKLKHEFGFNNMNEIAQFLLNEFHRSNSNDEMLEISKFAKANNIDIIKILSSDEIVEFEQPRPTMTTQEIKENIEEISKPVDIVPPVDDKVKEILD